MATPRRWSRTLPLQELNEKYYGFCCSGVMKRSLPQVRASMATFPSQYIPSEVWLSCQRKSPAAKKILRARLGFGLPGNAGPICSAIGIGADGPASRNRDVPRRFNQNCWWTSVIVGPNLNVLISRQARTTVIELRADCRSAEDRFAVCHQVNTLDRAQTNQESGSLPSESLREVEEGLKAAMDLD